MNINKILKSKLVVPVGRVGNNIDNYIQRAYGANYDIINKIANELNEGNNLFGSYIDPKKMFEAEIKGYMERHKNATVQDAIRQFGRTEVFLSREEKNLQNAIKGIVSDPETYKNFRKSWGWTKKIDWNMLQPTEDSNIFIIGNLRISFENSPLEVIFTVI